MPGFRSLTNGDILKKREMLTEVAFNQPIQLIKTPTLMKYLEDD